MDNEYMVLYKKASEGIKLYGTYRSKETADNVAAKVKQENPFWTVIVKKKA